MSTSINYPDDSTFACHCCGELPYEVPQVLKDALDAIVSHFGITPDINCCYRCPEHNASPEVGGAPSSNHLLAEAIDIDATNIGVTELAEFCESLELGGVLRYYDRSMVHIDDRSVRYWSTEA